MSLEKVKMPEQDPKIRNKNFEEVTMGYTLEMAIEEADRCLNCKNPKCVEGCPVSVKIPEFIMKVKEGDIEGAYRKIVETNSLPAVCGRVCPQESQCEGKCVRGIKGEPVAVGRLERFCADYALANNIEIKNEIEKNNIKVAVVGSGPAGLAAAGDLAKKGYSVTIFEAFHDAGGVLTYGIPEFRLPKSIVQTEIDNLKKIGVAVEANMVIGRVESISELFEEGFESVFVATGAGLPRFMEIPGENFNGVYSSSEFLSRINLMKAYMFPDYDTPIGKHKSVAVVGGGNVAMDAARCAKRLGAENVYIVYRRSLDEMPARNEEIHHAMEEEIEFNVLTNPVAIKGNDDFWVTGIECVKMELGEPDSSGRRSPVEIEGSNFELEVDAVIMAIGQTSNPIIYTTEKDIKSNVRGNIIADDNGKTSMEGVYAGGDIVTGAATVIKAMGAGRKAAEAIDEYLQNKK